MGAYQDSISGGLAAIRQAAGVSIVFRRGGAESDPFKAKVGRTEFVQESGEQVIARIRTRDYLIGVEDYKLEDQAVTPEDDDRILETINGRECEFQICSEGGEPPYVYSDTAQTQFRIHTKQVA